MKRSILALLMGLMISVFLVTSCGGPRAIGGERTVTPSPNPTLTIGLPATPVSPTREETVVHVPAAAEKAVSWARADVAKREIVAADAVRLIAVEPENWRNSSLGCPQPGMVYLQVITPGYRILFQVGDEIYEYHSARDADQAVLCQRGPASSWDRVSGPPTAPPPGAK